MLAQVLDTANYTLSVFAVPTFVVAAVVLILGAYYIVYERFSFVSKLLFSLSLCISVWLFSFSLMYCARDASLAFLWSKAAYLGLPLLPSLIYHFTLVILRIYQKFKKYLWFSWIVSAMFLILALRTDLLVSGIYRHWWGYYPKLGILGMPYLIFFVGLMFISFRHFWIEYRKAMPGTMHQRRVRMFLISYCVVFPGLLDYVGSYGIPLYAFGYLPVLVFLAMFSNAIIRYGLVDITPAFAANKIIDTMTGALLIIDQEGVIRLVNGTARELFGRSDKELIGKHISEFIQNELFSQGIETLKNTEPIQNYEIPYNRQGVDSVLSLSSAIIKDRRGQTVAVVCIARDITERRRAEDKLVRSMEALQSVYTIATTVRTSYEAACDQVVSSLSNLLKVPYVTVQHVKEDRMKIISSIMDGKLCHNEEVSLEHSPCAVALSGNVPCQARGQLLSEFKSYVGVPVKGTGEKAIGLICAMDHADRVFTEDEIRLIEIFARYVAYEFEREMMETQLRQMERMKLLGQVATGVAHEVRNPLNAILGVSEALFQDMGKMIEYKPFLDHIRTQVDCLSRLMGELLELGKPIHGSSLRSESLAVVSEAAINLWRQTSLSAKHHVRLIISPGQRDTEVMVDNSRLQQVFLNLLDNAAQHSPEGSEIQFVISAPNKAAVRVCVIDQGSGVAPENLERVFEPFFTTRKKGIGLGLSIVKNTIEAFGGDIMMLKNSPTPGCTVEITLPTICGGEP